MGELFDNFVNANSLYKAFLLSKRNSIWKESVQRYESNLLLNIYDSQKLLKEGTYRQKPFSTFTLNERGHKRFIKSLHISDRVIQKSLCNTILPILRKHFIYDNGASMKNKGISFIRNRLKTHLHRYFRKYGNEGYILFCDFKKFFDNIPHDGLMKFFSKYIKDEKILKILYDCIEMFNIDVSYMNDDEYKDCMNNPFSLLDYYKDKLYSDRKEKIMRKSVGIGSEISQISGVGYVSYIDNFIKNVCSVKFYGRYMDDLYIIHKDKEYLKYLYEMIRIKIDELGMFLSDKKTRICKLNRRFNFLHNAYILTSTGKLINTISHLTLKRHRKRIRKLLYLYKSKKSEITLGDIVNIHKGCMGSYRYYNSYIASVNMNRYFVKSFNSILGVSYGRK